MLANQEANEFCRMCGFGAHRHQLVYHAGWATVMCSHEQISDLDFRVVREVLHRSKYALEQARGNEV